MDKALVTKKYEKMSDCDIVKIAKNETIPENIRNEARHALWYRYELQTYKMQHALEYRIRENRGLGGIDMEDFFPGAYEGAFLKALEGVKLDKIVSPRQEATIRNKLAGKPESEIQAAIEKKRQSWKFYQGYQFYLQNYTNRDIVGKYLKTRGRDISQSVFTSDEGEDFSENINSKKWSQIGVEGDACPSAADSYLQNENSKIFWDAVNSTVQKLNRKQLAIWKMREQGERKKTIAERTGLSTSEINQELRTMRATLDSEIKNQEKIHKMNFVLTD